MSDTAEQPTDAFDEDFRSTFLPQINSAVDSILSSLPFKIMNISQMNLVKEYVADMIEDELTAIKNEVAETAEDIEDGSADKNVTDALQKAVSSFGEEDEGDVEENFGNELDNEFDYIFPDSELENPLDVGEFPETAENDNVEQKEGESSDQPKDSTPNTDQQPKNKPTTPPDGEPEPHAEKNLEDQKETQPAEESEQDEQQPQDDGQDETEAPAPEAQQGANNDVAPEQTGQPEQSESPDQQQISEQQKQQEENQEGAQNQEQPEQPGTRFTRWKDQLKKNALLNKLQTFQHKRQVLIEETKNLSNKAIRKLQRDTQNLKKDRNALEWKKKKVYLALTAALVLLLAMTLVGLVLLFIGFILTITVVGAIFGVPLMSWSTEFIVSQFLRFTRALAKTRADLKKIENEKKGLDEKIDAKEKEIQKIQQTANKRLAKKLAKVDQAIAQIQNELQQT